MISLVVFWCSVELDFKLQEDKLQPLMKRLCPTTDVHFAPLPYPQEAFTSTPKRKSKADSKKHARWKLWFLWEPLTTLTPWGWRRIQAFGHLQLMSYQTRLDLKDLDTKIEGGLLGVPPCWKLQNVTETKNEVVFFLQEKKKAKTQIWRSAPWADGFHFLLSLYYSSWACSMMKARCLS